MTLALTLFLAGADSVPSLLGPYNFGDGGLGGMFSVGIVRFSGFFRLRRNVFGSTDIKRLNPVHLFFTIPGFIVI